MYQPRSYTTIYEHKSVVAREYLTLASTLFFANFAYIGSSNNVITIKVDMYDKKIRVTKSDNVAIITLQWK